MLHAVAADVHERPARRDEAAAAGPMHLDAGDDRDVGVRAVFELRHELDQVVVDDVAREPREADQVGYVAVA